MTDTRLNRRRMLQRSGGLLTTAWIADRVTAADHGEPRGQIIGEPTAEKVARQVFADGGNAVDAIVAGALAAAVAAPHQTGIGGYALTGIVAVDGGRRIVAIDGNSAAPAALTVDRFRPDEAGKVPGRINEYGWLATGVPGVLAGLSLALERFGTRSFRDTVQPALQLARDGVPWPKNVDAVRANAPQFASDAGSRSLYFRDGQPYETGEVFKNPRLAEMLTTLAAANSAEPFYRGEIAQRITAAFQKHGGLVTAEDLAAYRAQLVEPIQLRWGEQTIHTAPLTAGGLTPVQALNTLRVMNWNKLPAGLERTHARIEALRLAWRDRLALLGDPEAGDVPVKKLLSDDYARESAERIQAVVKQGKYLAHAVTPRDHSGTIHLSAADAEGNFAAFTLTHGNSFGARVTVEDLGLTLGHGMSRFDPQPGHPNAPGPGKRPLHNMCPTIVTRDGRAILAAGARGGRRIPNALFEVLTQFVALDEPLAKAIAAPRMHTEGSVTVEFEKTWPEAETAALARIGYTVKTSPSATVSAVAREENVLSPAMR